MGVKLIEAPEHIHRPLASWLEKHRHKAGPEDSPIAGNQCENSFDNDEQEDTAEEEGAEANGADSKKCATHAGKAETENGVAQKEGHEGGGTREEGSENEGSGEPRVLTSPTKDGKVEEMWKSLLESTVSPANGGG